jgi:mono/diheme cytochrome c family protein
MSLTRHQGQGCVPWWTKHDDKRQMRMMWSVTAIALLILGAMGINMLVPHDTTAATPGTSPADRGDADAGRKLALDACTGCHLVSDEQRFPPLLKGAPSFREIANRPNVTAAWLRRTIAALPQVPRNGRMANPLLTDHQLADVVAYIMTLQGDRTKEP